MKTTSISRSDSSRIRVRGSALWIRRALSTRPWLCAPLVALLAAAVAEPEALAQPTTRGTPVLRTPGGRKKHKKDDDDTSKNPGQPVPPTAPTTPAAPLLKPGGNTVDKPVAADAGDPMAGVKMAPKEIDFKPQGDGFLVNFNLDDADLPEIVKAISNITGRRFIYGGKLRQIKATVYSPDKVTAGEAYAAFLSILDQNQMTIIPHGRYLKIVETPGIAQEPTPIYGQASLVPDEDRYITRLYHLAHMDAGEASTVLSKFKTKEGDITAYGPSNLLIITETGSNLKRLMRIAEEIDVGGAGEQIYVEPINYGSANEMAQKLNEILGIGKPGASTVGASPVGGAAGAAGAGAKPGQTGGSVLGGGAGARIISDDRANTLIMVATEGDYRRLLDLINRMDVKQSGEGEIHVIPLQYAACKDLSQTLNQILGTSGGVGAGGARPPGAGGATPAAGGARPGGAPGSAGTGAGGVGLQDEVFEGRIRVTCDEATNSLVTTSSLRDYAQLRNVIDKLDIPRRQVFIEAVVMDVSIDRSTDINIGYHGGAPIDFGSSGQGLFYGGNNVAASVSGVPSNLQALALGVRGPDISGTSGIFGTGVSIPAIGMVLSALAQDGDNNVLATPHILATDNQEAIISIGQNIPLQTNVGGTSVAGAAGAAGALGALGALGTGFSAPRQDIGTKIDLTPHVNDSDQVRIDLKEEISDAGSPQGALGAIPINKRTAQTTLVVRDQETVIIGGLMRDAYITSDTKIPVLGDIPVLGFLFKQSHREKQKSNLLLILTPYVIRDQDDLRAIFERKMQERQEFIDRYFVFNDNSAWTPPRDFSRANGLVEDIRQSIMAQEEKQRLEDESKPKALKTHVPTEPIALPAAAGRPGQPAVEAGAAGAPAAGGGDTGRRNRQQGGTNNAPAPRRER